MRHLRSGADVDIMFTDIDLGEGMDGAQLACVARETAPLLSGCVSPVPAASSVSLAIRPLFYQSHAEGDAAT